MGQGEGQQREAAQHGVEVDEGQQAPAHELPARIDGDAVDDARPEDPEEEGEQERGHRHGRIPA